MTLGMSKQQARWRVKRQLIHDKPPPELGCWLFDPGSLTRRLQLACEGRFSVQVLAQTWRRSLPSEARALGIRPSDYALERQVLLLCDNTPWVYARTLIPHRTMVGEQRQLACLGNRPLGAFLFANPAMEREEMEVACLKVGDRFFHMATAHLEAQPAQVWGRRSLFRLAKRPLLVYEIFLPEIGRCRG